MVMQVLQTPNTTQTLCAVVALLDFVLCSHCLFGRNWGCAADKEFKNLHFELCYYQAIEEAIQRKLPRVEAGAQGEHKLQRGLLPNFTYSAHYMPDPIMQGAVQKFLDRENAQVGTTRCGLQLATLHETALLAGLTCAGVRAVWLAPAAHRATRLKA
jgi:predicted N-acyltransferase